ncbi:MAG: response regulator [Alphaproteobacteria bacterium]|nr:response regulator [Alphaproteobacteria bacterium]
MFAREDDGRTGKDSAPRILIVEDDFLVALEMEAALSEAGFAVVGVANTAAEATEMAKASQPALAVMDIRLAGVGDGIDAALAIYHLYRIRSIFASAHGDETVRARAIGAAPLGWLQKPYSMASLVGAVRRALMEIGT